jgi:hypothetical protein
MATTGITTDAMFQSGAGAKDGSAAIVSGDSLLELAKNRGADLL